MDAAAYRMCFDEDKLAILCAQYDRRLDSIGMENAKLRELVRQMYPRAKAFLQMGVQLGCNDSMSYDWQLQMRELKVEVDG